MLIDDGELVMRRMSCPLKAVVEMRGCIADYEVWSNFKLQSTYKEGQLPMEAVKGALPFILASLLVYQYTELPGLTSVRRKCSRKTNKNY